MYTAIYFVLADMTVLAQYGYYALPKRDTPTATTAAHGGHALGVVSRLTLLSAIVAGCSLGECIELHPQSTRYIPIVQVMRNCQPMHPV
jgi:hypothetical protein